MMTQASLPSSVDTSADEPFQSPLCSRYRPTLIFFSKDIYVDNQMDKISS